MDSCVEPKLQLHVVTVIHWQVNVIWCLCTEEVEGWSSGLTSSASAWGKACGKEGVQVSLGVGWLLKVGGDGFMALKAISYGLLMW